MVNDLFALLGVNVSFSKSRRTPELPYHLLWESAKMKKQQSLDYAHDMERTVEQLLEALRTLDRLGLVLAAIRVCEALEILSPGDPRIALARDAKMQNG